MHVVKCWINQVCQTEAQRVKGQCLQSWLCREVNMSAPVILAETATIQGLELLSRLCDLSKADFHIIPVQASLTFTPSSATSSNIILFVLLAVVLPFFLYLLFSTYLWFESKPWAKKLQLSQTKTMFVSLTSSDRAVEEQRTTGTLCDTMVMTH